MSCEFLTECQNASADSALWNISHFKMCWSRIELHTDSHRVRARSFAIAGCKNTLLQTFHHGLLLSRPTHTPDPLTSPTQLDRLVGLAMLIVATTVFLYYTTWTLLMVRPNKSSTSHLSLSLSIHPGLLHNPMLMRASAPSPSSTKATRSTTSSRPASGLSVYRSFSSFSPRRS